MKLSIGNSFTDGGRVVFNIWLSPQRGVHSFETFPRASRIENGPFSICGSRLSAAHIRFKHLQELHALRAGGVQNVALALARRTFVLRIRKEFH
eukprot:9032848-Pyramimonas_sp.AAC.1